MLFCLERHSVAKQLNGFATERWGYSLRSTKQSKNNVRGKKKTEQQSKERMMVFPLVVGGI